MKVVAGNGTVWRIGRRRLPWRYRARGLGTTMEFLGVGEGCGPLEVVMVLLFVLVVLPWTVWFLLVWLVALLLIPFLALGRALGLLSTLVVAYPLRRGRTEEWRRSVASAEAGAILARVRDELVTGSVPRSLSPPADRAAR